MICLGHIKNAKWSQNSSARRMNISQDSRFQMIPNDSKWSKMIPTDSKWFQMIPNDSNWSQMIPTDPKWSLFVNRILSWLLKPIKQLLIVL